MAERHINTDPILGNSSDFKDSVFLKTEARKPTISRRNFMQLGIISSGSALATACLPTAVNSIVTELQETPVPESGTMKEFSEFSQTAEEMKNLFGETLLLEAPHIIRDVYEESNKAQKGIPSKIFASSLWGSDINILETVVEQHTQMLINTIEVVRPNPYEHPSYIPPTQDNLNNLKSVIARLGQTFPAPSLTIDKYKVYWPQDLWGREGTHLGHREGTIIISMPFYTGYEGLTVGLVHETGHGYENYYLRTRPYTELADFAKLLASRLRAAHSIADSTFRPDVSFTPQHPMFRNLDISDPNSASLVAHVRNVFPEIPFPKEIVVDAGDTNETINYKLSMQFNLITQIVGTSRISGKSDYLNTLERTIMSDKLMSLFFSKAFHFLVGPHQRLEGGFPYYYDPNEAAIRFFSQEHHKTVMEVCAKPEIANDPLAIRESLGLEQAPNVIVPGIEYPQITDFQFSQFCRNVPNFRVNQEIQVNSTRLTPLSYNPDQGHFQGRLEISYYAPINIKMQWSGTYVGIQLIDKEDNVIASSESEAYPTTGKKLIVGFNDRDDVVAFLLPDAKGKDMGYWIAKRSDIVEHKSGCP